MITASPGHLFVYGTLRSDDPGRFGRAQRERLMRESRSLGPATLPGRLVDLGKYPGLVEADANAGLVHGELVVLHDPGASFSWLDPYESIVPGDRERSEYLREQRDVTLAGGARVTAWVYLHLRPGDAPPIPGGDWVGRHVV